MSRNGRCSAHAQGPIDVVQASKRGNVARRSSPMLTHPRLCFHSQRRVSTPSSVHFNQSMRYKSTLQVYTTTSQATSLPANQVYAPRRIYSRLRTSLSQPTTIDDNPGLLSHRPCRNTSKSGPQRRPERPSMATHYRYQTTSAFQGHPLTDTSPHSHRQFAGRAVFTSPSTHAEAPHFDGDLANTGQHVPDKSKRKHALRPTWPQSRAQPATTTKQAVTEAASASVRDSTPSNFPRSKHRRNTPPTRRPSDSR